MVNQNSEVVLLETMNSLLLVMTIQSGLSWQAKSGEYYVGIGTFSEAPEDFELNVDYEIKMTLSPAGYFVMLLMFVSGFVLNKYK